ncbi:hypothetical protein RJ641_022636 [Dillenia turbinata]|uniref:C3H1-type domain-containing protein n=1 Tax=Dillenia turbinata TaxID=194707 RepID=A0AAN8YUL4_9MAGN
MENPEENCQETKPSSPKLEETQTDLGLESAVYEVVEEFKNVGLQKCDGENDNKENSESSTTTNGRSQYPLRPYAEDCPYYMKTGSCKFGLNCRFNHPVVRKFHQGRKESEKEKEETQGRPEQIECKYYLTPGGCKYGNICKYKHRKENKEVAVPPELNFLGLPMRLGERECPFYMRNGSCGYGANCRFHHPDPMSVEEIDTHKSPSNSKAGHQPGTHNRDSAPQHLMGASHAPGAPWLSHMVTNPSLPHPNNSQYIPVMHPQPPQMNPVPFNAYQAHLYPPHSQIHSAAALEKPQKNADTQLYVDQHTQVGEFPERPGQPECSYFVKTGDCKYKSACRYHHPKDHAPRGPVSDATNKGPPLRSGKKLCRNIEQYGSCKYGRSCLFYHPMNSGESAFAAGSVPDSSSGYREGSESLVPQAVYN